MIKYSEEILTVRNLVDSNDVIVIVAGVPLGVTGGTNLLKMHKIE
jgi:pyruvate kinase